MHEDTLDHMYIAAKYLYDNEYFEEAACCFIFLTLLDSSRYGFWIGLANSEFFSQNFDAALFAYTYACEINPANPICYLFMSKCFEALRDPENAISSLDFALDMMGDNREFLEVKAYAQQEKVKLRKRHRR